ncbi:MAG: Asp-tRNA(Asn)/Glu-tRNA(Gln) amidotransferase subunit GatA [Sphingobacteriales bacterium JAD_PAG50586_3]|nr:MAG: Asp-tRNA(Asn)/Glu-tRNA(Gln) amidotransferase subunit GatA [Sphingobacteriales bacterium JAD_PAG50586_3]
MVTETPSSLKAIRSALAQNNYTLKQLVAFYLGRIDKNAHLNAFLEVFADEALANAEAADSNLQAELQKPLTGLVLAIKDNLCFKGHKVSASSKILENFESLYTATAVQRLIDAGAIIIGRTSCDEFAMGSSNETSAFGNVLNPLDSARVPGGSSGGSAAAVAAGLCTAALGTDTGGSIRQPSSLCGVVGLKPTYGRVSRYGAIAYASSFDQIGPIALTVDDTALIYEVMGGKDDMDATTSTKPIVSYSTAETGKKYKIAYIKETVESEGLDPEIRERLYAIRDALVAQGHTVEAVDFPYLDYLIPTYYILTTAEASSNLARYDGIHYGYRSTKATDLESTYKLSRSEGFGKEVQRRIMLGTFVLSAGYYDAYYSKGQKVRRILRDKCNEILSSYDFMLTPTTPSTAFKIGENTSDPIKMYLEDIYTVLANLAGLPAISLPLGKHSNGLPFGMQLTARNFDEARLLQFSIELEQNFKG